MSTSTLPLKTLGLLAALFLSLLLSLRFGAHTLAWADIGQFLTGTDGPQSRLTQTLLLDIRLPRILAALGIGGGLSLAGATYQGLFRNPLVSPDILGASSGSALGAALGILLSLNVPGVQLSAFIGGLVAVALTCLLSRSLAQGNSPLALVLTGMVVGSLGMAGIAMVKTLADPYSKLPLITYWLLGGLSSVTTRDLLFLAPPLVVGTGLLLLLRWQLNAMALGEEEAKALGVPVNRIRYTALFSATLITAVSVSVAGIIGWVGLMVPHLVRFSLGPDNRVLLPASALCGALFLLWADNLARWLFSVELPLGVLTCACGVPIFLLLLRRSNRTWAA